MKAAGLASCVIVVSFILVLSIARAITNIWLSEWTKDANNTINGTLNQHQVHFRLGVYGALGGIQGKV